MTDLHTTKAFDSDLQDLSRMVAEMGGLAEKLVADSVDALAKRDSALAQRITQADANIDALQREIEEKAINTIARRQPMAVDLREIVGALAARQRSGAHRRSRQEHRQARDRAQRRIPAAQADPRRRTHGRSGARPDEGGARCLCPARHHQGDGGVARRRGNRRGLHLGVPRAAHLYDGRSAQHHVLHPSAVLRQEHRAHGRPRHQHRRDGALRHRRPADRRPAAEGRHHDDRRAATAGDRSTRSSTA